MTIQDLLVERGIKQSWLAKNLGVKQNTMSMIVTMKQPIPVHMIKPMAKLIGISPSALLDIATKEQ